MGGKYRAYPEYKESGVEWLGDIPIHWKTSKLRYEFFFGKGLTITKENLQDKGTPCVNYGEIHSKYGFEVDPAIHSLKCVSDQYLKLSKSALLYRGDLVFSDTSEDIDGSGNFTQLISDQAVFAGYHTIIARPKDRRISRFYAYLFDSQEFRTQIRYAVKGVKVFSITQAILRGVRIWLPTLEERRQIANFLDHETAKIDALIEKQQQLIQLLKEKRQAVISHAVTKGLNPNAPMRDSGVEWLGDVPVHWVVSRVGFEYENLDGRRVPLSAEERSYMQGEYPYYGASGVIDHIDDYIFDENLVLVSEDGANLLMRSNAIAFPAYGKYWVNNHAHILKPKDHNIEYWAEVIEVRDLTPYISGAAQPKFTSEALNNLKIIVPPTKNEVDEIALYIIEQKEKYSLLISKAKSSIKLMQERRTALISAAVTGKIDVRAWQAPSNSKPITE